MVDALDLGSSGATCESSSLSSRTILNIKAKTRGFMQTQIEKLDGLKRKLTIQIDWESIYHKEAAKMKEFARTANIPGFRKGKVPLQIVKQRYGQSIRQESMQQMLEQALDETVKKEAIEFASQPEIIANEKPIQEGEPWVVTFSYEVYPKIELNELENATITQVTATVLDKDVEIVLQDLQKKSAKWEPVDRPAQTGDQVNIDFVMTHDGEIIEDGEVAGFLLTLGANQITPEFDEALIGMEKHQERRFDLTFPEDFLLARVANKTVQVTVKLNEIKTAKLPPLDDKFAEEFQVEGGMSQLKEALRQRLENDVQRILRRKNVDLLFDLLIENNQFELPESLVNAEVQAMTQRYQAELRKVSHAHLADDIPVASIRASAEKRIATQFIMDEIVKKYDIQVDKHQLQELYIKTLSEIGDIQDLNRQNSSWFKGLMQQLAVEIIKGQILEQLVKNMNVEIRDENATELVFGKDQNEQS